MTDAPRGPTTEELRARVLAHESRERATVAAAQWATRGAVALPPDHDCDVEGCDAVRDYAGPLPEGRTFYDPATPPHADGE